MDRQAKRILILMFFILHILVGCFLIFLVQSPEILFFLQKPKEKEIEDTIEFYENLEESITEERLLIPSIGVDMEIGNEPRYLDFGGWIQELNQSNEPQVISAHRFGWDKFSPDQKMKQTLYHVDKLRRDDLVIILWDKKVYFYKIIEIGEGTNNPSMKESEFILYTCKFWNSSERIFVVLEKTDITL